MIKEIIDLRGGYFTDVPSELMRDNELLTAENCYWKNGVLKRGGVNKYHTSDWSALAGCKGGIRANLNDTWYSIIALDDDTDTKFYYGTGTTWAVIDATYTFTKGLNVEFAELNGHVVAVDGTDKPAVIYYSAGLKIKALEQYDVRTRADEEWYAGQYTNIGTVWTNDTTDAQDAGANDFEIGSNANSDGCFIACDYPFTKVIFKGAQQAGGAPVTTYKYWNGTAWASLTLETTPTWTDAAGDRTLEFAYPTAWEPYTSDDAFTSNKYVILIQHTTAPAAAFSCDYLLAYHTHYLTQITEDVKPQWVYTHGSRLHLFCGCVVYHSLLDVVTGWKAGWEHGFWEGGKKVVSACTHNDNLLVFKEKTLYSLSGNSFDTWVKSKPLTNVGTVAGRSVAMVGPYVFFVSHDGVYLWTGEEAIKISKHIQTDIDLYTLTTACGISYKNAYWLSFPSSSIVLWADPDTFRRDELGDGRLSFFKFSSYKLHHFMHHSGSGDNGFLLGIADQASPCVVRCDNGTTDNPAGAGAVNISMDVQTKDFALGGFSGGARVTRVRIKLGDVALAAGQDHTFTLHGEVGSYEWTVKADIGSGAYTEDMTMPFSLDGKVTGFQLEHDGSTSARLIGFAVDYKKRRF